MPKYRVKLIKAAKAAEPHEILVYGPIGKSYYSNEGISAKEFADALNEIPKGQKVIIGVNSQGGEVGEGIAIYHAIERRAADITVRIDGYAISIASVFPLAASKVISPKSAIWMLHQAWCFAQGNAGDMRAAADMLDTHDSAILGIYTKRTGKSESEILMAMEEETYLTGREAVEWGLADEASDNKPALDALDFSGATPNLFKAIPANFTPLLQAVAAATSAPKKGADQPPLNTTIMPRAKIIALLKKHGIAHAADATDEQLLALVDTIPTATTKPPPANNPAPPAAPIPPAGQSAAAGGNPTPPSNQPAAPDSDAALVSRLAVVEAAFATQQRAVVAAAVQTCVDECRIPVAQREAWITRAMADETVLNDLRAMPQNMPGGAPVSTIEVTAEDPRSIFKAVNSLWCKTVTDASQALDRGRRRGEIIMANIGRILQVWNTNTIDTNFKRATILQMAIRAFAIRVMPLAAFSTRLGGFRLEGTNKVVITFWDLDSTASHDFVAADGYNTFGNTARTFREVELNKRKYQGLSWTSEELARQPFLDIAMGVALKTEKLAADVVNDVLTIVTAANYGAAVKTEPAGSFDSDDVIELKGIADLANWPSIGRSLVLNSAYDVNLLKDASVKDASQWGDNSPIREGRIVRMAGFDYYPDARVPANGENLQGFIAFKSAILVAFSPIEPTPEVRSQLTRYEVVTEPTTGATFEYRLWGDPDMDTSKEIIEANYGFAKGNGEALKRITSA